MKRRLVNLRSEVPLLDIVSYGRAFYPLTPAQRAYIARTVRRPPEVMVKVSGGAHTLRGVAEHMKYIGREGKLELETDLGERVRGKGFEKALINDWDLDLDALPSPTAINRRRTPKLVHNLVFSMPAGTPPKKVLQAVRKLALNEWELKHRYAIVLHTDGGHPHVHVVLRAMSDWGRRLNIRKSTLRSWRAQFAENLREVGIEANATERAARGLSRTRKKDGIFRAAQRGTSWHMDQRRSETIRNNSPEFLRVGPGADRVRQTRSAVIEGWRSVGSRLRQSGDHVLADGIRIFLGGMPPPRTERELMAVLAHAQTRQYGRSRGSEAPELGRQ